MLRVGKTMTATLIKPSDWIATGIRVETINNLKLFKFTEELGDCLQELLDRKKADRLTPDEAMELEALGELDIMFTYVNAMLSAQS
jgi:hypothetical protein